MKDSITIQETLDLLNGALKDDPEAINNLVDKRVNCNDTLADHPTIQVYSDGKKDFVGLLGILNGLFGVDEKGSGPIAARVDDEDKVLEFVRTKHT